MIKKLGQYEILGVLGKGSMGVVYKGVDSRIGKIVAIKTMNKKILKSQEMQERFFREGAILGQLQHKNIIHVYNVGVDHNIYYMAMEYLEGISLYRLIKQEGMLPRLRVLEIMKQVCEGVHAAHGHSVIHRDLKPANIFVMEDDHIRVLDFGVAHFQNSQLTNSGMLLGTINYIAPEQIIGLKVDYRADIFSMGVIFYELLSGANPFSGKNISQTMVRIVNENLKPIPSVPDAVMDILDKALHKDRSLRYANAKLMAEDIEKQLREQMMESGQPIGLKALRRTANKAKEEQYQKMLSDRIEAIKIHIRRGEMAVAERLLGQLKDLEPKHKELPSLVTYMKDAEERRRQKQQFVDKLTHDSLLKASALAAERHYISAIELCEKVLKLAPESQDARVIKANAIHKMEQFLEKVKR